MKVTLRSALCIFLSILFVVYLFPASVIAEALEEWRQKDTDEAITDENTVLDHADRVDALFELTDLRTEDTKYIRMSDGTYRAVVYKIPVHEKDENGVYQEVDNRLSSVGSDYESAASRVKFAKKVTGNERIFTLKNGNRKISLALADAKKGTSITVANDGAESKTAATKWEELTVLQNSISSVRYNGILPGTDLEYILLGSTLKENILIHEKQNSYTYTFELSLNNLTANLNEDGSIHFITESGEVLYRMPAPYLYDAGGAYSSAASYALSDAQNGKYTLTLSADSDWINAKDRAFPVTLDPTIDMDESDDISDTYIDTRNPNSNFKDYLSFDVGNRYGYTQYAFIQLNSFPKIPIGSMVTNVGLNLDVRTKDIQAGKKRKILLHKVTALNSLANVTWNNGHTVVDTDIIYDYETINANTTSCYFDITKMYHEWQESDQSRIMGFSMVGSAAEHTDYIAFTSSECMDEGQFRPYVEISYISTIGIEDYFSYRTQSAGDAGTIAIGDHTGQLTLSLTDAVSDNSALSVSIGHVYNSVLSDSDYTVLKKNSTTNLFNCMKLGNGFMLSTQQTMQTMTVGDAHYAVYTDGDGTVHYMKAIYATDETILYNDTDGLGLTVTETVDPIVFPNWLSEMYFSPSKSLVMEDQSGNTWLFYNGLLTLFADSKGNLIKYMYSITSSPSGWFPYGANDTLRMVVQNNKTADGYSEDIVLAQLNYTSDHYLSSITSRGRTLHYIYTEIAGSERKQLTKITVNETVNANNSYSYTLAEYKYTNGILTDVYDSERQYGIHYTYNNEIEKYTEYYEFAGTIASHTKGSEYEIEYAPGQTSYRYLSASSDASDDIIIVSVFDTYGRTVNQYIQDDAGNVYGASTESFVNSDDFSNNSIASTSSIGAASINLFSNASMEVLDTQHWIKSDTEKITDNITLARNGWGSYKMNFEDPINDELYVLQTVTVPSAGTYCFSVYVNMSEIQAVNTVTNGGVTLQIYSGTQKIKESTVYSTHDTNVEYTQQEKKKEWKRIHVTFNASANANYKLRITGKGLLGALYLDDAQLEKGSVPGAYNLLSAGFSSSETHGWRASDNTAITKGSVPGVSSDCLPYRFEGNVDEAINMYQILYGVQGRGFTFSGWVYAPENTAPYKDNALDKRYFGLRATVSYSNNDSDPPVYIPFNPAINGKQYACGTVIP
ncbi:MAG: DNRLRE domain-containing protein, partial [Ruminococcaceae bacterium]|nr:DNRLRE domain-containing protein [Oscillospiraceae bacterium]